MPGLIETATHRRANGPVDVEQVPDEHQHGDCGECAPVALEPTEEEQEERNGELHREYDVAQRAPATGAACDIPACVGRNITDPDDQELRERDVTPENRGHEEQRPERTALVVRHRTRQWRIDGRSTGE